MKTIKHEFSLDLLTKAKNNPDKYQVMYSDGTKPIDVVHMRGLKNEYCVFSWCENDWFTHYIDGHHCLAWESNDLVVHELVDENPNQLGMFNSEGEQ